MTPEKEVQSSIMKYMNQLKSAGYPIFFERRQAGGFSYKMGIPDLYCSFNGYHVEIEVKAPGKQLRPMQMKFKDRCEKELHIRYICVDNLEVFKLQFKQWFGVIL